MNTIKSYNIFYNIFFLYSYDESVVIQFDFILILNELTPHNIVKNIIKSCYNLNRSGKVCIILDNGKYIIKKLKHQ